MRRTAAPRKRSYHFHRSQHTVCLSVNAKRVRGWTPNNLILMTIVEAWQAILENFSRDPIYFFASQHSRSTNSGRRDRHHGVARAAVGTAISPARHASDNSVRNLFSSIYCAILTAGINFVTVDAHQAVWPGHTVALRPLHRVNVLRPGETVHLAQTLASSASSTSTIWRRATATITMKPEA
jgi:hypothetical protein